MEPIDVLVDYPLERIDDCTWRIPRGYKAGMQVEGRIFADDRLIQQIRGTFYPSMESVIALKANRRVGCRQSTHGW